MKISVNWLKELVQFTAPDEVIAERLTMAGLEVKKIETVDRDRYFEIEITSNRPDWLSHIGVAREIAALENLTLHVESPKLKKLPLSEKNWEVCLKETEGCPYYSGVFIEGIQKVETPAFMKERLQSCGMRSISFPVDVTNYVLLLTGQPLHAFDASFLDGQQITIRSCQEGERFVSIKGNEISLTTKDLAICDQSKIVALAGIMGGKNSEIQDSTENIFLESAFFNPRWVRPTTLRTGLKTDSSYRFERRVDPEMVDLARDYALELIIQYARPKAVGKVLCVGKLPKAMQEPLILKASEIEECLGHKVSIQKSASILKHLGLRVLSKTQTSLKVKVPSFRPDLTRSVDLIEEVARIYGYDQIPETLPVLSAVQSLKNHQHLYNAMEKARDHLTAQGFYETVTFSLVSDPGEFNPSPEKKPVILVNPQNKELNQMRRTFLQSLLSVVRKNYDQQASGVRLFEMGNLYEMQENQPLEKKNMVLCVSGALHPQSWRDTDREVTYYDLKGWLQEALMMIYGIPVPEYSRTERPGLNPDLCQNILVGGEIIGYLGQVHTSLTALNGIEKDVFFAEVDIQKTLTLGTQVKRFQSMPKFPPIYRDLAIVVNEDVKAGKVKEALLKMGEPLIVSVELFDLFRGGRIPKGQKNLAFRLTYQSSEKTLISDEIQELHAKIAKKIQETFKAAFQ